MGTKRRGDSTRGDQDASNTELLQTRKDGIGRAVEEVIERERRNLQRASAVLASLTVAVMYEEDQIAADDVAYVAREVVDRAVDALDLVELAKAAEKDRAEQPP